MMPKRVGLDACRLAQASLKNIKKKTGEKNTQNNIKDPAKEQQQARRSTEMMGNNTGVLLDDGMSEDPAGNSAHSSASILRRLLAAQRQNLCNIRLDY